MFHFDPHWAGSGPTQAIDFISVVPLFRLSRFWCVPARKNRAGADRGREKTGFSYYILKRNKRNSGTRQLDQRLSAFRIVPHCSAFAAFVCGARPA